MILELAIMEVLKRHSSEQKTRDTKPLKAAEITKYLTEDFPDEHRDNSITDKRVYRALRNMTDSELSKADEDKSIRYTVDKKGGKSNYWTPKSISDVELKYLIDSVMYSKIFDSETAQDFAGRIQQLSGKNLYQITRYAKGNVFGEQRLTIDVNVLENIQTIMDAKEKDAFISFDWSVYDVVEGRIGLKTKPESIIVKPIHIILSDGRYFMLGRYQHHNKIYHFSVDLMSKIAIRSKIKDKVDVKDFERDFERAKYMLQHPYNMGGTAERFKIRVKRQYLSRVVDAFSYGIKVVPDSITETTVDIWVSASLEGMKRWLLFHYDIAEVLEPSDELKRELDDAVNILWGKYCKKDEKTRTLSQKGQSTHV